MPPHIQLKIFYRAKQKQLFGEKEQDYKDGSGLGTDHYLSSGGGGGEINNDRSLTVHQFRFHDRRSRNQRFHSGGILRFLIVILSF